jgi:hypothetical protein
MDHLFLTDNMQNTFFAYLSELNVAENVALNAQATGLPHSVEHLMGPVCCPQVLCIDQKLDGHKQCTDAVIDRRGFCLDAHETVTTY